MPITEFVFPSFKPELAEEAQTVARNAFKILPDQAGVLQTYFGHITRQNGEDITNEYRCVLNVEWQDPSYFHAFFPSSPQFQESIASILPYAAGKAAPALFQNANETKRSLPCFQKGATQVFVGEVGDRVTEVEGAWGDLVAALRKEGRDVVEWTGLGIGGTNGNWVGILGWPDIETIDSLVKNDETSKAVERLRKVDGVQEYGILFEKL